MGIIVSRAYEWCAGRAREHPSFDCASPSRAAEVPRHKRILSHGDRVKIQDRSRTAVAALPKRQFAGRTKTGLVLALVGAMVFLNNLDKPRVEALHGSDVGGLVASDVFGDRLRWPNGQALNLWSIGNE